MDIRHWTISSFTAQIKKLFVWSKLYEKMRFSPSTWSSSVATRMTIPNFGVHHFTDFLSCSLAVCVPRHLDTRMKRQITMFDDLCNQIVIMPYQQNDRSVVDLFIDLKRETQPRRPFNNFIYLSSCSLVVSKIYHSNVCFLSPFF